MLNRNKVVVPLEECFAELGLDPAKTLGAMERNSQLVEDRTAGTSGSGEPPIARYGEPAHIADRDLVADDLDDDLHEGEVFDEGLGKWLKKKVGSVAKMAKKKAHLLYKKVKGVLKSKGKKRRKTAAYKKTTKRHAVALKRAGGPKKGRILRTAGMGLPDDLTALREDLNTGTSEDTTSDMNAPFEEATVNAAYLCVLLSECFEVLGDEQSAHTLMQISDDAATFSEDLIDVETEDDLTEDQSERFEALIESTIKALKLWEGFGAPSLSEAIEQGMAAQIDG